MVSDDLASVKIIDFGYATPIDPSELAKCDKHFRGRLSSTKNYMAPELYSADIDYSLAKADVFSLGVILNNFLSGGYFFDQVFEGTSSEVNMKYQEF